MAAAPIKMWVDFEPFNFGVVQAHAKLSKVYLKKVLAYARGKGSNGGYPNLSWSVWRHMAINKMLLPERSAWAYFSTYYFVKDMTRVERLEEGELIQQSFDSSENDQYKTKLTVKTLEFVLHLYLQQSAKTSLRTSLFGEEWPKLSARTPSSDGLDSPKLFGMPSVLEDSGRLSFVISHISDLIDLLSEPDMNQGKPSRRLSVDAVHALGYIVKAYSPKLDAIVPLHSIAIRHRFQSKSGFSRTQNDFSCHIFDNWIRSSLSHSPFALNSLLESGRPLSWTMSTPLRQPITKRWRILCHSVNGYGNLVLFLNCCDQTICQQSSVLKGSCVRFMKCNRSHFYMLSPLKSVSIEKCHDSIFVLGPVVKCIRVTGCSNITLIAPCRSVIIGSSTQTTAHVASPSRPLIIGESSSHDGLLPSVTLAPYHTSYRLLEEHLTEVGFVMSPQIDKWNNPMCISHVTSRSKDLSTPGSVLRPGSNEIIEEKPTYRILPPTEFYAFVIPFQSSDSRICGRWERAPSEVPWGLPEEYACAAKAKQEAVKRYKSAVKGAKMTRAERKRFQIHVETQFKEWLADSGNKRQLDDLVEIARIHDEAPNEHV